MTGWGKNDIIVRTKRKGELCFIFLFGAGAGITSLASTDLQCWQSIINTHHTQLNTNEYHRMIRSQQDVYQWMNFLQCVCTASGRRDPKVCDCTLLIHSVFLQEAGGCKASWKRVDESRGNQTRWWQGHGFTHRLLRSIKPLHTLTEPTSPLHSSNSVTYVLDFRFYSRSHQLFSLQICLWPKKCSWSDMHYKLSWLLSEGILQCICQGH